MLEALRKASTGWLAKGLLLLLVGSFAIWGVADVIRGRNQGPLATIGSREISAEAFRQRLDERLSMLTRQFGQRITVEQARAFGMDRQVLSNMLGEAAVDQHAEKLGLGISEAAVIEAIRNDPRYRGAGGQFDREIFNGWLAQHAMTEQRYIVERRRESVRQQIIDAMAAGMKAPDLLKTLLHRHREETRTLELFTLDAEKAVKVPEPDEAALKAYFDANKGRYRTPELRKLQLLWLRGADVRKTITVEEKDLREYYEQEKETFNVPERRHVFQLSFPDKAAAEKAAAEIAKAANFAEGAKALSLKESDYDLGEVTQRQIIDPKIRAAAFALEKDKLSQPIEGRFTTALLYVKAIEPGKQRSLDDVKDEIKERILEQRVTEQVQDISARIEDGRAKGVTLKELATQFKLPLVDIAAVDREGKGPDGKPVIEGADAARIMTAAFGKPVGAEVDPVTLGEGGNAWVDILAKTDPKDRTLEEVKAEVGKDWREAEHRKLLLEVARKLVARLNAGETLEALAKEQGVKVETTQPATRGATVTSASRGAVSQAFALAEGAFGQAESADGRSRTIFRVAKITLPPPPTKEQEERLTGELARQLGTDRIGEYILSVQDAIGSNIDEAVMRQTLGLDRQ